MGQGVREQVASKQEGQAAREWWGIASRTVVEKVSS
jgi:hypothetical protein